MPDDRKRIDAYIASAAPFAQPILRHVRAAIRAGAPSLEERLKWGVPAFVGKGIVAGMAAFKAHATFGFWRWKELADPRGLFRRRDGMMGTRYTDVKDLPARAVIAEYAKRAAALDASGARVAKPRVKKPEAKVPADLAALLAKNAKARAVFEGFPPSHRREYVEWIEEAKRPETRERRLAETVKLLGQGKARNWKYEKC